MLKFEQCVEMCLNEPEFVAGFNKLAKANLGKQLRSGILAMVDQATGFDEIKEQENLKKFVAFVYETVWTRLPIEARDPTQVVTPPEGYSFAELIRDEG